jgi:hypothetical protein
MLTQDENNQRKHTFELGTELLRYEIMSHCQMMSLGNENEYKAFYDAIAEKAKTAGTPEELLAIFIEQVGGRDVDLTARFLWKTFVLDERTRTRSIWVLRREFETWLAESRHLHQGDPK